jgi:hypothetical protein
MLRFNLQNSRRYSTISEAEENFGSSNYNELSARESEYESQSDPEAEDKLPMSSVDVTTAHEKCKVDELKWNPSCSSPDKPTRKPFRGMPGINGNVTGSLLEEVRPVHVFNMFLV